MLFICEHCGYEMDYDEDENAIIECEDCGEYMVAVPEDD